MANLFTRLPSLKVLSRPSNARKEVTVYIKGFLAEGDSPENFGDWMHSHRLLVLSPAHKWAPSALGYSWPSGSAVSHIPVPLATLGSVAYVVGRNVQRLRQWKLPTPASLMGALVVDAGLHCGRLAYQFNTATVESKERAEMLAGRLLELRTRHDYLRVVSHSLGCRHLVEACALLYPEERPDEVHLCAPALVASDLERFFAGAEKGLGRENTVIYYSEKDLTLGVLLRALLMGQQAVGEIGLPGVTLPPSVRIIDCSRSLGGFYVGAHTDYADKFHFFASPRSLAKF